MDTLNEEAPTIPVLGSAHPSAAFTFFKSSFNNTAGSMRSAFHQILASTTIGFSGDLTGPFPLQQ